MSCPFGIWKVGLVTIPFGVVNAIVSFTGGRLVEYTGRIPIFTFGMCVDLAIQVCKQKKSYVRSTQNGMVPCWFNIHWRLISQYTHLPPGRNDRYVTDDIFKRISMNERSCIILHWIALKFAPRGPIDNKTALVQVMAWRRAEDKPLLEHFRHCIITSNPSLSQAVGQWPVYFPFENIRSLRRIYSGVFWFECKWPNSGWPPF